MQGCESCTIKKAECQRIDAFELWCWRRCLRVPWTARRCNQSILKEISPEYSLQGLMLKLKLQHFGHLMQRSNSLAETLMLGKMEGRRRRGWQRTRWHRWLNGHEFDQTPGDGREQGSRVCCSLWGHKASDMTDWTTISLNSCLTGFSNPVYLDWSWVETLISADPSWVHNQLTVVRTRNDWLGLPQTHCRALGHKGSRHSGKQFDEH